MPQPTPKSFVGIAKETTPGTPVPATAFIPVSNNVDHHDIYDFVDLDEFRGSMAEVYGTVRTVGRSEFSVGGRGYADTIGWPLAGILGDVTTTGAGAPYTHAISLKNSGDGQPTTHTLTDFYVAGCRQYPALKWTELTLKFSAEGVLEWTAKSVGFPGNSASTPTQSYTAVLPTPVWLGAVTIAGVAQSLTVDGELTITRKYDVVYALNNSQVPITVFLGRMAVKGKLTAIMDDDSELNRYLTGSPVSFDLNFQQGAGATLTQIDLNMNQCQYRDAKINRGKEYIQVEIPEFIGIANTTNAGATGGYSPIKATLQNAVAGGTYQ